MEKQEKAMLPQSSWHNVPLYGLHRSLTSVCLAPCVDGLLDSMSADLNTACHYGFLSQTVSCLPPEGASSGGHHAVKAADAAPMPVLEIGSATRSAGDVSVVRPIAALGVVVYPPGRRDGLEPKGSLINEPGNSGGSDLAFRTATPTHTQRRPESPLGYLLDSPGGLPASKNVSSAHPQSPRLTGGVQHKEEHMVEWTVLAVAAGHPLALSPLFDGDSLHSLCKEARDILLAAADWVMAADVPDPTCGSALVHTKARPAISAEQPKWLVGEEQVLRLVQKAHGAWRKSGLQRSQSPLPQKPHPQLLLQSLASSQPLSPSASSRSVSFRSNSSRGLGSGIEAAIRRREPNAAGAAAQQSQEDGATSQDDHGVASCFVSHLEKPGKEHRIKSQHFPRPGERLDDFPSPTAQSPLGPVSSRAGRTRSPFSKASFFRNSSTSSTGSETATTWSAPLGGTNTVHVTGQPPSSLRPDGIKGTLRSQVHMNGAASERAAEAPGAGSARRSPLKLRPWGKAASIAGPSGVTATSGAAPADHLRTESGLLDMLHRAASTRSPVPQQPKAASPEQTNSRRKSLFRVGPWLHKPSVWPPRAAQFGQGDAGPGGANRRIAVSCEHPRTLRSSPRGSKMSAERTISRSGTTVERAGESVSSSKSSPKPRKGAASAKAALRKDALRSKTLSRLSSPLPRDAGLKQHQKQSTELDDRQLRHSRTMSTHWGSGDHHACSLRARSPLGRHSPQSPCRSIGAGSLSKLSLAGVNSLRTEGTPQANQQAVEDTYAEQNYPRMYSLPRQPADVESPVTELEYPMGLSLEAIHEAALRALEEFESKLDVIVRTMSHSTVDSPSTPSESTDLLFPPWDASTPPLLSPISPFRIRPQDLVAQGATAHQRKSMRPFFQPAQSPKRFTEAFHVHPRTESLRVSIGASCVPQAKARSDRRNSPRNCGIQRPKSPLSIQQKRPTAISRSKSQY